MTINLNGRLNVKQVESPAVFFPGTSFKAEYNPGAESGLDRFLVKVLHMNEGGGPGNAEPALIMIKEGVFCPPDIQK